MDPLTISAASGLRSRMESLDMLANNLANTDTAGYKKDTESYSLYMSDAAYNEGADADPVTAVLPVIDRQWTDFGKGVYRETGNPLDLAISGDGFFTVDGPNGTRYTRNGQFRISPAGSLETADGYKVRTTDGTPIQVTSTGSLEVSSDGTVRQSGQVLGQLAIAKFTDPSVLAKAGATYYSSNVTPDSATSSEVLQGRVEGSNVNSAESSVRLIHVMRQFEILTKAVQANDEMNRRATDEVARVGS